jgi:hypothetical protein
MGIEQVELAVATLAASEPIRCRRRSTRVFASSFYRPNRLLKNSGEPIPFAGLNSVRRRSQNGLDAGRNASILPPGSLRQTFHFASTKRNVHLRVGTATWLQMPDSGKGVAGAGTKASAMAM